MEHGPKTGREGEGAQDSSSSCLHDLHGNVSELCEDTVHRYSDVPGFDPLSTSGSSFGVVTRGGSFADVARDCRSADRSAILEFGRGLTLGFRPAIRLP